MVDFSAPLPRLPNGEPDVDIWLDRASGMSSASRRTAVRVLDMVTAPAAREPGLMLVELLLQLRVDIVTVMAGMALFAVGRGDLAADALPKPVASLVGAVRRLSATDMLARRDAKVATESASQADDVRRLLTALIDDPRVAVLKLAERVVALRHGVDMARMPHVAAYEAMEFFAPLAGRLGIWQLKWTLEDLAFRRLFPKEYQEIAARLDGRREARERQVEAIRQDLAFRLATSGIRDAEVQGRAKHIYSIWSKMNHKAIGFKEVYDVQAVRVLVADVDTCYRVVGIVHNSWPHIAREFDDYIANPKANGYRSIHTAVVGPTGKNLEVQIRTRTMHEECELGICAHWAYKNANGGGKKHDVLDSQKIDWLRSLLEWHEEQRDLHGGFGNQAATANSLDSLGGIADGTALGLTVTGRDRDGLLRDVTTAVARANISMVAATAKADVPGERATITLDLRLAEPGQQRDIVAAIERIRDVAEVRRT